MVLVNKRKTTPLTRDFIDDVTTVHLTFDPRCVSPFCSRSERTLYLHSVESLSSGAIASAPTDVSPSTLIPFYDPDTSVVILTGKVNDNKQTNKQSIYFG
jgi:hypothetical protein